MLNEGELGQLGVLHAQREDASTEFAIRSKYRLEARKAFVKEDCGRRAASAILRKAAPVPMKYGAGDMVCYMVQQGANEPGSQWSSVARIIGFEGKTMWVICEGVPVATSLDKLRPCTSSEALAYQVLSRDRMQVDQPVPSREQQGYLDARRPLR